MLDKNYIRTLQARCREIRNAPKFPSRSLDFGNKPYTYYSKYEGKGRLMSSIFGGNTSLRLPLLL